MFEHLFKHVTKQSFELLKEEYKMEHIKKLIKYFLLLITIAVYLTCPSINLFGKSNNSKERLVKVQIGNKPNDNYPLTSTYNTWADTFRVAFDYKYNSFAAKFPRAWTL